MLKRFTVISLEEGNTFFHRLTYQAMVSLERPSQVPQGEGRRTLAHFGAMLPRPECQTPRGTLDPRHSARRGYPRPPSEQSGLGFFNPASVVDFFSNVAQAFSLQPPPTPRSSGSSAPIKTALGVRGGVLREKDGFEVFYEVEDTPVPAKTPRGHVPPKTPRGAKTPRGQVPAKTPRGQVPSEAPSTPRQQASREAPVPRLHLGGSPEVPRLNLAAMSSSARVPKLSLGKLNGSTEDQGGSPVLPGMLSARSQGAVEVFNIAKAPALVVPVGVDAYSLATPPDSPKSSRGEEEEEAPADGKKELPKQETPVNLAPVSEEQEEGESTVVVQKDEVSHLPPKEDQEEDSAFERKGPEGREEIQSGLPVQGA